MFLFFSYLFLSAVLNISPPFTIFIKFHSPYHVTYLQQQVNLDNLPQSTRVHTLICKSLMLSDCHSKDLLRQLFTIPSTFSLQKVPLSQHSCNPKDASRYLLPTRHICRYFTIYFRLIVVLILRKGRLAWTRPSSFKS